MSAAPRPKFFEGQILSAADLRQEQQHHRRRKRRQLTITATVTAIVVALWCWLRRCCQGEGVTVDGEPWTEVASLDQAGPEDRVYVLDRRTGTLTFGHGEHGRRPPAGVRIDASYRVSEGT